MFATIKRALKAILRKCRLYNRPKAMSNTEIKRDRLEFLRLMKLNNSFGFEMKSKYDYICKYDKYASNGAIDNQYFIQDIWGARKVWESKPKLHYDVGSSVGGFIAHILAMNLKVCLIDIRAMNNDFDTNFVRNGGGQ